MFTSDRYNYNTNDSHLDYEFESIGRDHRVIKKVARFSRLEQKNLYSFGFGDLNEATGELSDTIVSNNGDGDKVLRTVAAIIYSFTGIYTNAMVYIKGSTPARTRKYQMGINRYWEEISIHFEIWGLANEKWEPFKKAITNPSNPTQVHCAVNR